MSSYNVELQAFINDQTKVKEEQFIEKIRKHQVFQLGDFVLKSGFRSPIYIDCRRLISEETAHLVREVIEKADVDYDYVVGVPLAAMHLASLVSRSTNKPILIKRPQAKAYGTKKLIEGDYEAGERALIVEDVVTTGASIQETAKALRNEGLIVEDAVCVLNREQGGMEALKAAGIRLHSVLKVSQILEHLEQAGQIDADKHKEICEKLKNPEKAAAAQSNGSSGVSWRLDNRVELLEKHPLNRTLLSLINKKEIESLSADVIKTIEQIKDHVCVVKLHVDSLTNATPDFFSQLRQLADESGFMIFEDRKFADIGNTSLLQLTGGSHRIADWADLVTANPTPGTASIQSFEAAISDKTSKIGGVLLVAEMSSEGTLTDAEYVRKTVEMGKKCSTVVSGFVCQKRCADDPQFFYWTPGVNLSQSTDGKGQQWRGVKEAIVDDGNDIVIVGRGITNAKDIKAEAQRYQEAAWTALQSRE
ncbi:Uridine 5'-monophosphate synthase [Aphelenchoides besseyi]|nr:Uridine 5'-monophosphate synthase [Aphelenchoides besseyi]